MKKEELAKMMLEMNKKNLLLFDVGAIAKIQQEMKKNFGEKADKISYDICYEKEKAIIEMGMPMVPEFSGTQISEVDKIMSMVDLFEVFTKESNFGEIFDTKIDVKKKRLKVKIRNNPVALATVKIYGISKKPQCSIQRGIMAGLWAAISEVETVCKETKCVCCGDEYCEFIVKKVK